MKQFHNGDPYILDTTAANVVLRATWRPRYLHPWSKGYFTHREAGELAPLPLRCGCHYTNRSLYYIIFWILVAAVDVQNCITNKFAC